MSWKKSRVNPLAARKQLLIAESEINRARLLQEWQTLAGEVSSVTARAKSFNGMAASILSLVAAVGAFTSSRPAPAAAQSSWLQKISNGVRLATNLWLMFRSRGSNSEKR